MTSWNLTVFNQNNGQFIREYELSNFSGEALVKTVTVDETLASIEARENPVPFSEVQRLSRYVDEEIILDESYSYFVGLTAD